MDTIKHRTWALSLAIFSSVASMSALADIQPVTPEHCSQMRQQGVISDSNPVGCERLRLVTFSHHDFDGNDQRIGQVVVLDAVAKNVQIIFDILYDRGFVLSSAKLMENYAGDDAASMADNNTSAFNGRKITGGGSWSNHAYGAAIDLNPVQNPFISIGQDGRATIAPVASARLAVNRLDQRPGKALLAGKAEEVVALFADYGFINWGGYWNYPIDYQHFEVGNKTFIKLLASSPPEDAERTFDRYVKTYRRCVAGSAQQPEAVARKQCAEKVMR